MDNNNKNNASVPAAYLARDHSPATIEVARQHKETRLHVQDNNNDPINTNSNNNNMNKDKIIFCPEAASIETDGSEDNQLLIN